jgi:hypothetical protein
MARARVDFAARHAMGFALRADQLSKAQPDILGDCGSLFFGAVFQGVSGMRGANAS